MEKLTIHVQVDKGTFVSLIDIRNSLMQIMSAEQAENVMKKLSRATLDDLLEKQKELDNLIMKNALHKDEITLEDHKKVINERILALYSEAGEFTNEVESFKYWKKHKRNDRDKQLEEFTDILFFWLSVAHTMQFTAEELKEEYMRKWEINKKRQEENY